MRFRRGMTVAVSLALVLVALPLASEDAERPPPKAELMFFLDEEGALWCACIDGDGILVWDGDSTVEVAEAKGYSWKEVADHFGFTHILPVEMWADDCESAATGLTKSKLASIRVALESS